MRLRTILLGGVGVVVAVVAGAAVYVSQMDFNQYRGLIAEQAKSATGRDLAIKGPLTTPVGGGFQIGAQFFGAECAVKDAVEKLFGLLGAERGVFHRRHFGNAGHAGCLAKSRAMSRKFFKS